MVKVERSCTEQGKAEVTVLQPAEGDRHPASPTSGGGVSEQGWGAGISSQFSLAQRRSAPFLPGSPLPALVLSHQKSTAGPT